MLGGRTEVVDAPALELMKYMSMAIEDSEDKHKEKQAELYINYLSQIFSQPLQEKPSAEYTKAKKEFEELINPTPKKQGAIKSPQAMGWDFDVDEETGEIIQHE